MYGVHFSFRSTSLELKYILRIALRTFTQPVNYHATEVLTFQPGHLKETGLLQIENYNFPTNKPLILRIFQLKILQFFVCIADTSCSLIKGTVRQVRSA
jgi:hypothetical protein